MQYIIYIILIILVQYILILCIIIAQHNNTNVLYLFTKSLKLILDLLRIIDFIYFCILKENFRGCIILCANNGDCKLNLNLDIALNKIIQSLKKYLY